MVAKKKNGAYKSCTNCGACKTKKKSKTVKSKGIKAYLVPDIIMDNPYEEWDQAGTPLYIKSRWNKADLEGRKGEKVWMFCNKNFSMDAYEERDFRSMDEICDYLKHFGCVAVPLYGSQGEAGIAVIDQERIKKEGFKDRKHAAEVLKAEAEMYEKWAEGEVYGFVITDDGQLDTPDVFETGQWGGPEIVYDRRGHPMDDEEVLDSCFGFVGEEWAIEGAKEAFETEVDIRNKRLAKEQRMLPQDRRYTIIKTDARTPKNARAQLGNMRVGDTITLKDGTKIVRTANRRAKPAPKKNSKMRW